MARCGVTAEESENLTTSIKDALRAGPLGRAAIHAAVRPKASKRMRYYMENVWSIVRLPVAEGLVCYGPGESNEATFIRVDQWLPDLKAKAIPAAAAQCALFRKYLSAYGPATLADFSHWSGISMQEVKPLQTLIAPECLEFSSDKRISFLLRDDAAFLAKCSPGETCVRLLPIFDSYLLAHREKDHLLNAKHYKRVYRNQGWISPVVLIDGAIAGVWHHKLQNKKLRVDIDPFGKLSRAERAGIEREANNFALFLGGTLELGFLR
jgi:hypothetical protein